MNTFKKIGLTLMALSLATGALTACGNSNSSSTGESNQASQSQNTEKTNIKIWTKGSGPDQGIQAIIDSFNASQDAVNVAYEYYGENYASVIQMAIQSGSAPDVLECSGGITVQTLARQGSIVPVDDVITDEIKNSLHPDTLKPEEFYLDGKLYSVPVRVSAYRLLYNKTLFEAAGLDPNSPPTTLEEMRDYAKTITEYGEGKAFGFGLPLGVAQIWERVIDPILYATGESERYGWDAQDGKYNFESNKNLFNYYVDLMNDGSLFPGYLTLGIDTLRANFAAGTVGMYVDGTWMAGSYATQMDVEGEWDAAPLPAFEGQTVGSYWAEGGVNWVVAEGKNVDAAKSFYSYWLTNQDIANQYMPVPRTVLAANDLATLPIEKLNVQGLAYSFRTDDLSIPAFEPHKFISLEGDDRNTVLTNLFAKAAEGNDIQSELDSALADLDSRYTQALESAIQDGTVKDGLLK